MGRGGGGSAGRGGWDGDVIGQLLCKVVVKEEREEGILRGRSVEIEKVVDSVGF